MNYVVDFFVTYYNGKWNETKNKGGYIRCHMLMRFMSW